MVLFLHNRYRTTGGEERVVEELLALVRERLGEPAQLLARDSATLGSGRAALGLLRGGLGAEEVGKAVRLANARVVHAHNLHPAFGWRALAAARRAGARVVLHLHQYRLVCANGVCFTHGRECTRCHGRNTLPGVALNCRGSRAEGLAYGAALAFWQQRMAACAEAVVVPSEFARERLRRLGAPLDWGRVHVLPPPVHVPAPAVPAQAASAQAVSAQAVSAQAVSAQAVSAQAVSAQSGPEQSPSGEAAAAGETPGYALVVSRLAPEKGVDVAIDACRMAGVRLVVAGEGPQLDALRSHAAGAPVEFAGQVDDGALRRLRARAALAIVPSRSAETFGLAAAEAMAAGVPVVASRVGALPELVDEQGLVAPGDAAVLAEAIARRWNDRDAARRGRRRVGELCSPEIVAGALARIYDASS